MAKEDAKDAKEDTEMKVDDKADRDKKPLPPPPLVAAAQRLDKLLSDTLDFYSIPQKVVRRWLGMSSGAAGEATLTSIAQAAHILLDPTLCQGVSLLTSNSSSEEAMSTEEDEEDDTTEQKYVSSNARHVVETWLLSLVVRLHWQAQQYQEAFDLSQKGIDLILTYLEQPQTKSSPSLFPILARLFRWRSLCAESMPGAIDLTADMALQHNLATLRRDVDTQATLLNGMLRELLKQSQVEQAQKLLANSTFPESSSNNQLCRFLYYSGRIQALRLEYTSSFSSLSTCLRKIPTNTGLGFRIACQRLLVVVQLLMGEIPERRVFFENDMQVELEPYLNITQAVRQGDLGVFETVVTENAQRLKTDGTYTLISRLAHQVVKAGLRKLHIAYSRLSLQDVADRLGLPSAQSAEYVVAKAVRDGVLDATIHHEEGYMQSHDLVDVYATKEPAEAFHRRIVYCLTTHNDAIRGMRFPPDEYKRRLESSRGNRRKRSDDKTDEEKAKELEDELEDDY